MDAVIAAGGLIQPGDLLYNIFPGGYKALLDIHGKPMIQWVLDAISATKSVARVIIVGLPADCGVTCSKPLTFLPDQNSLVDNARTGVAKAMQINPSTQHVLFISSDVPGISGEMVDWVVDEAMKTDDDLYYLVITRQAMEKRYPSSKRTYLHLKDMEVCGGDVNVLRAKAVTANDEMWRRLIDSRKNPLKQASLLGFDTLFFIMFHLATLEKAVELASKHLRLKGRAIVCPYPEIGMDVDKPFQLEIMRADLAPQK